MVCFFKQKISIWVHFGGFCNGKSWHILDPFGLFYGHWKYFMAIWYILWSFGIFPPVLVSCTKKNLATLRGTAFYRVIVDDGAVGQLALGLDEHGVAGLRPTKLGFPVHLRTAY
jgi:hypothetical protein